MNSSPYTQVQTNKRLYEEVAGQIEQRIIDGELRPGDKLTAVSVLAEEFGVSHIVIREALHYLQSKGLVTIKHGSGVYIQEPTTDKVAEMFSTYFQFNGASILDLHEVRELLEVRVAGLAAERATDEDKTALLDCLKMMEVTGEVSDKYVELDLLFHTILAKAAGNAVLLLLLEPLMGLLRQSRLKDFQVPGAIEGSFYGHEEIYKCVSKGDIEGAREAMRLHLKEVEDRIKVRGDTKFYEL